MIMLVTILVSIIMLEEVVPEKSGHGSFICSDSTAIGFNLFYAIFHHFMQKHSLLHLGVAGK